MARSFQVEPVQYRDVDGVRVIDLEWSRRMAFGPWPTVAEAEHLDMSPPVAVVRKPYMLILRNGESFVVESVQTVEEPPAVSVHEDWFAALKEKHKVGSR